MKKSLIKQMLLISIGLFMYSNAYSQEVNMNRWIEIVFSEDWRGSQSSESIYLDFVGDSANTKIKVVSGWYERTKTIGEDWGWIDTEFFLGADTMRIYGNVKKLETINHYRIKIVNLDNNSEVTQLLIYGGGVSKLEINDCDKLEALSCTMCRFDSINLSNFTELKHLCLDGNPNLLNLDLSNQTKLEYLYISGTRFASIDISHLNKLKVLYSNNSYLTSLDLRGLSELNTIQCYDTKISTAGYDSIFCALPERSGIGNDYGVFILYLKNYPSTYNTVMATNSQNAISKGWYVLDRDYQYMPPTTGTFDCSLIGIDNIELDIIEAKIYPNPAIDNLSIETKEVVQRLEVYDALGRKVVSKIPNQNNFSIDISNFERGIYILKLQTKEGIGSYKIVKN